MKKVSSYYIIYLLVFISCSKSIDISQLEVIDNISYINGKKFSGIAIKKDDNNNVRVEEKYNEGVKYYTKLFYPSGSAQSEWIYGLSTVSVTRYYKSGKVESRESFDKDLVRNGTSYLYYKNGNLKSEWNFKDGLRDGLQKNFFGDGTLSDETETIKGVQNGFMRVYDREGKLIKEIYFKDGFQIKI